MLSIQVTRENGKAISATVLEGFDPAAENRNHWATFEEALEVALLCGKEYVATDAGAYCSPRYDVVRAPQVGDEVSYAFNGDYYPCGTVKQISASGRRVVAGPDFAGQDRVFFRRRATGSWIHNGTWSLVPGHVEKRNREF